MQGLDFIGDIHGYHEPLVRLLHKLGYRDDAGVYRHPEGRKAVFLGDLIDRGPGQRAVVNLVRRMVEEGEAECIMGNHEFNAIAFHQRDPENPDEYLRKRTESNWKQTTAFKEAYPDGHEELDDLLDWFLELPITFEAPGVRAVHATWSERDLDLIRGWTSGSMKLDRELMVRASRKRSPEYEAVEVVLKGPEVDMPEGSGFHDKEGKYRTRARIKWWEPPGQLFRDMVLGPPNAADAVGDAEAVPHDFVYPVGGPLVFVGHYWLRGTPEALAPNIACLDYSVAGGGKLCAYRFDGEAASDPAKFVWVEA